MTRSNGGRPSRARAAEITAAWVVSGGLYRTLQLSHAYKRSRWRTKCERVVVCAYLLQVLGREKVWCGGTEIELSLRVYLAALSFHFIIL